MAWLDVDISGKVEVKNDFEIFRLSNSVNNDYIHGDKNYQVDTNYNLNLVPNLNSNSKPHGN